MILKLIAQKSEEFWIVTIALLMALTLASNHSTQIDALGFIANYLYWICRILIESAFFIAVFFGIEKYCKALLSGWSCYLCAVLLSLIPFTLSVTALDIIIGLPELGINDSGTEQISRGWAFVLELFYLLDNHLVLGMLLLIPRCILRSKSYNDLNDSVLDEKKDQLDTSKDSNANIPLTFFDSLEMPLDGRIYSMEAQEHYILVTTTVESRMILHRFSDAVKRTPLTQGMQVHRSHWVAHSAVKEVVIEGQSMKLKLVDDRMIPVSRTFRAAVESKYSD